MTDTAKKQDVLSLNWDFDKNKTYLKIYMDGTVWANPDLKPDNMARKVLLDLNPQYRQLLEQRNTLVELLEEFMLSDMDHPSFDDAHNLISEIKNGEPK